MIEVGDKEIPNTCPKIPISAIEEIFFFPIFMRVLTSTHKASIEIV
jgi:hypothetical protein